MIEEYIDKIIEIGKKKSCSTEDYIYFKSNLPDVSNKELNNTLRKKYKISTSHLTRREFLNLENKPDQESLTDDQEKLVTFITNLIKGCHLIEVKHGGFGSTTNVYNLFGSLIGTDLGKAIDLYNWIASNGGNYYIESNVSYVKSKKIEQEAERYRLEKLSNDHDTHLKALAKKQQNKDQHNRRSNEAKIAFNDLKEKFQKMDDKQLITIYNEDIKKKSLISARGRFQAALREEFVRRNINIKTIAKKTN